MAVLWSRHVAYPSCRQCQACGCVFTFEPRPGEATTPCRECNAPVPVDAGAGLTDVPIPTSEDRRR